MEITPKTLVERFYYEVWNRADEGVAREILHPDFRFRASLGPELRGPEGFIDYMRSIHAALAGYTCIIDDLVVTPYRAAARMTFKGVHRGRFFSVDPTGREIRWEGCAFFTTDGNQIVELWVLGDVDSVKQQLNAPASSGFSSDWERLGKVQRGVGDDDALSAPSTLPTDISEREFVMTDIPKPPQTRPAIPADDPQRKLAIVRSDGPQIRHISVVGDTYTILLTGDETGGRYCLIDAHVPPGRGPPPHRHDFEEMFTILEGEIEVTFRGKTVTARAGETINIPANAPHAFRNSADAPARMLIICTPAGMDQFFIAIGDPVDSRTAPPPKLSEAEVVERMVRIEALAPMYRIELVAMNLGVRGSGVRLKAGAKPDEGIRPEDLSSENDG